MVYRSRAWYGFLKKNIMKAGLKEMKVAPCVFRVKDIISICYVDDWLILERIETQIDEMKNQLMK